MSNLHWAVELSAADAESAQNLRLVPGVEARYTDNDTRLWLRGSEPDLETQRLVRKLPCLRRFAVLDDGRAIPEGKTVPVITLLGSGWIPLRHLNAPVFPPERIPGSPASLAQLKVAPATVETAPNLIIIAFQKWHDYAILAPEIRLEPLRFAVSEDARAVIHGSPLPPLLGCFFTVDHGIAVPCGFALDPPINYRLLAEHYRLSKGDVLLFQTDGRCELVDSSGFAQASRGALRATATELAQEDTSA